MRCIEQQAKRELATEVDAIQNAFMDEAVFREAMAWPKVPARLARSGSGTSSGSSDPWNMSVQRSSPYPSPATSEGAVSRSNGSSQMAKSIQPVTLAVPPVPIGASVSQEAPVEDLPEGWMVHVAREGRFTGRTFYSYPGANGDRVSTWSLPPNPKDLPVITRLGGRLRQHAFGPPKKPAPELPSTSQVTSPVTVPAKPEGKAVFLPVQTPPFKTAPVPVKKPPPPKLAVQTVAIACGGEPSVEASSTVAKPVPPAKVKPPPPSLPDRSNPEGSSADAVTDAGVQPVTYWSWPESSMPVGTEPFNCSCLERR